MTGHSLEVVACGDRRRAEALALELRAVARQFGLRVETVRVVADESPDGEAGGPSGQ